MNSSRFLVLVWAVLVCSPGVGARERDPQGRRQVPQNLVGERPSIYWVSLRASRGHPAVPLKDPDALSRWLDDVKAQGFYALEIFSRQKSAQARATYN
jgi:hypothetical protein